MLKWSVHLCFQGSYLWKVSGQINEQLLVQVSWNVMAHGDAREGKWMGNWRMEWVASTLHTTTEHGISSITTADEHTSASSSRLNWRPPPIQMDSSVSPKDEICFFCAYAIIFQLVSNFTGVGGGFPLLNSRKIQITKYIFFRVRQSQCKTLTTAP